MRVCPCVCVCGCVWCAHEFCPGGCHPRRGAVIIRRLARRRRRRHCRRRCAMTGCPPNPISTSSLSSLRIRRQIQNQSHGRSFNPLGDGIRASSSIEDVFGLRRRLAPRRMTDAPSPATRPDAAPARRALFVVLFFFKKIQKKKKKKKKEKRTAVRGLCARTRGGRQGCLRLAWNSTTKVSAREGETMSASNHERGAANRKHGSKGEARPAHFLAGPPCPPMDGPRSRRHRDRGGGRATRRDQSPPREPIAGSHTPYICFHTTLLRAHAGSYRCADAIALPEPGGQRISRGGLVGRPCVRTRPAPRNAPFFFPARSQDNTTWTG
jgi:hypothetical protein